jgi:hypothetical protein
MPVPLTAILLVIVVAAAVLLPLFLYFVLRRRMEMRGLPPETEQMVADARYEAGERPASLAAEQIEEQVKRRLAQYPDLAAVKIDFGSMPDMTIDIWVDDDQYDDVEDIPDERIREAIKAAAAEFNA